MMESRRAQRNLFKSPAKSPGKSSIRSSSSSKSPAKRVSFPVLPSPSKSGYNVNSLMSPAEMVGMSPAEQVATMAATIASMSPGKSVAMSPAKSPVSPFLRPSKRFSDFLMAKKKKRLLFQSPKKKQSPMKIFKSPLKCRSGSKSPKKSSASKSPSSKRKSRTPVKYPIDSYFMKRASASKSPLRKGSCDRSLPDASKSPSSSRTTKRQLNFGNKKSTALNSSSPSVRPVETVTLDEDANFEVPFNKKQKTSDRVSPVPELLIGAERLPIDWSLKTRLRFESDDKFPYRGYFTALEEATGTTSFVRCLHPINDDTADSGIDLSGIENSISNSSISAPINAHLLNCDSHTSSNFPTMNSVFSPNTLKRKKQQLDTSLPAAFKQHTQVWMHPFLPWLSQSLFPRIGVRTPTVNKDALKIDSKSSNAESLTADWVSSLRSLYHLIKARQAPFFYICADNMTFLFRAPGVGGINDVHVLITPTENGFRRGLRTEGISYVLPFLNKKYDSIDGQDGPERSINNNLNIDESSLASVVSSADNDEEGLEDEEPESFLEEIGLSQHNILSQSSRPRSSRGHLNKSDQESRTLNAKQVKKRSLVLIFGKDVHPLINFLSSNPTLTCTSTGPLASVPATLLSPVYFDGARGKKLKVNLNQSAYQGKNIFSLDINGPILPSAVNILSDFFKSTQGGNLTMNLVPCHPTTPFASFDALGKDWSNDKIFDSKRPQSSSSQSASQGPFAAAFATESLKDCGLPLDIVEDICHQSSSSKDVLYKVVVKNHLYIVEK